VTASWAPIQTKGGVFSNSRKGVERFTFISLGNFGRGDGSIERHAMLAQTLKAPIGLCKHRPRPARLPCDINATNEGRTAMRPVPIVEALPMFSRALLELKRSVLSRHARTATAHSGCAEILFSSALARLRQTMRTPMRSVPDQGPARGSIHACYSKGRARA